MGTGHAASAWPQIPASTPSRRQAQRAPVRAMSSAPQWGVASRWQPVASSRPPAAATRTRRHPSGGETQAWAVLIDSATQESGQPRGDRTRTLPESNIVLGEGIWHFALSRAGHHNPLALLLVDLRHAGGRASHN